MSGVAEGKGCNFTLKWHIIRGAGSNLGQGGGAHLEKGHPILHWQTSRKA